MLKMLLEGDTFWLKDSSQKGATCYYIQLQYELKHALLVIKVNNIEKLNHYHIFFIHLVVLP